MNEFYFQIKGRNSEGYWSWPPLHSGMITAIDKKTARKIIEEDYGIKFKMGGKHDEPFLLSIEPMDRYLKARFETTRCKQCNSEYTLNSKYVVNAGGGREFCSLECNDIWKHGQGIGWNNNFDFIGYHNPVIYKITNKENGLCYIGKTTQAFTLRWYQHFFQSSGTKFHDAIKQTGLQAWSFEVIEIINIPSPMPEGSTKNTIILERESYWIKHFDSINNGYNSVSPLSSYWEAISKQTQIEL